MLAFSEPALLYGGQLEGVLSISKIVMNVILSAGLAIFMHFTETRIGPELFSLDTIGGPDPIRITATRALEEGEHFQRKLSDAQESSQNDFETQAPALRKTRFFIAPRDQNLQPQSNDRNAYQPYVEIIKACFVELVFFSFLVVAFIRRVLPNINATADQRSLDDCDVSCTPTSRALLGEEIPPNDSGGPGENQRQPGVNQRRISNVLGDINLNDFRNRFIARGGPPPPPPPPPAFGSSMQHGDKWVAMIDYWISLLLLLPMLTFLLKRLFGGRKGAKAQGHRTVGQKAGTCPNVIPLRERRSPETTTVRWMLPSPNNQTRRTHLHNQALYPVNLTRWFIRFLFLLCTLALSSLFPVVALMLAIAAWYYLPDVILPFLLDRTIIGTDPDTGAPNAVGLSQNTNATLPEYSGPFKGNNLGDIDAAINNTDNLAAGTNRITNELNESTYVEYLTL